MGTTTWLLLRLEGRRVELRLGLLRRFVLDVERRVTIWIALGLT
jgi:hypothetical protein